MTGNGSANEIVGTWKSDSLAGAGGNDTIYGKPVSQTYVGNDDNDTIHGGTGDDVIYGAGGVTDTWDGGDTLYGDDGNDRLYGQHGSDTLAGGKGRDNLYGGDGTDRFDYDSISDSRPWAASRDIIYDFSDVGSATISEQIDLSSIDAISGGSDDRFTFIGTAAFTAPGQLRVSTANTNTLIQANTTGTAGTELEIAVADGATVTADQWLAGDFIL